ncbi:phytanoyl-CoA dioxygenase family protein [Robbsia sp. Bb-Pol-6]|uniref:Phytanoyl-CoA dioxygenase family protein n=1 Tax=Robbsia betulipollinis TaxID=2981849 RepID=A0ABT3ZJZ5_9BURK|nr:phytanoyl-CoA dioxygenase family protein [Robbsia betulipollinis]MCY0386772.1 phytanoyl-CoA dioxygenase family protein [Robbsia betulipollinis]
MDPTPLKDTQLCAEQLEFYAANGFLALSDVAQPDEIEQLRHFSDRLLRERRGLEEGALFDFMGGKPLANDALTQMLHPSNHDARFRRMAYRRRLHRIAKQVLGPRARFSGDHIFYKPALTGPHTPWHQDEAFRDPTLEYNELAFWLPLQAVDETNGCLKFIPGSHLKEVQAHCRRGDDPRAHALECCADFGEGNAVYCPLPMGGCTLHHGRTLHGAGPNDTPDARYAYVVHFDTPRTLAREPRRFPWQAVKSQREDQMQAWRQGPGRLIHYCRRLRQMNYADPYRLIQGLKRYVEKRRR